jgi:hypothetical protein
MVTPPFLDDDDVTPPRVSTGEMIPLVRVPLDELPRTSTRDVLKVPPSALAEPAPLSPPDPEADTVVVTHDDDITPVEHHFPKPPKKS